MKHEPIDKLFRDRLNQHETKPAAGGWNNLESMLDANDARGKKKGKKRGFIWYSVAAAVVLLAIIYTTSGQEGNGVQVAGEANEVVERNAIELADNKDANDESSTDHVEATYPEDNMQVAGTDDNQEIMQNDPVKEQIPLRSENYSQALAKNDEGSERKADQLPVSKNTGVTITSQQDAVVVANVTPAILPELEKQDPANREVKPIDEIDVTLPALPVSDTETAIASVTEGKRMPVTISYVNAEDEPDSDRKRLSMKRLIGLAKDIKEGDVGIGDLRQAKDNLIAGRYSGRSTTD